MSMFNCVNHVTVFRNNCAKYVARKKKHYGKPYRWKKKIYIEINVSN